MKMRAFSDSISAAAAAALALCAASASHGAIWYVSPNGTGDGKSIGNPTSIATGFSKAGNSSDEVVLLPGVYKLDAPVAASGKGSVVRGSTGDPEDVVLDAQGQFHVMRIANDILVHSLTIANGVTNAYNGGTSSGGAAGVRLGSNNASTTGRSVVSNCVIRGCYNSEPSKTTCGAVVMYQNSLLVDSVVTNNTAKYVCAGINVGQSGGTVLRCLVADNRADGSSSNHGAAICIGTARASLVVEDTMIRDNYTKGGTGAGFTARVGGTKPVFRRCVFDGNESGYGAAIAAYNSEQIVCEDCVFTGNVSTTSGGAVRIYSYNGNASSVAATGCTFDGNSAPQYGGAVHVDEFSVFSAENCSFTGNSARFGGAVDTQKSGRFSATGCSFEANASTDTSKADNAKFNNAGGGAIFTCSNAVSSVTGLWGGCWVTNSVFEANTSQSVGSAVSHTLAHAAVWEFVDCKFLRNAGVRWGGTVCFIEKNSSATQTTRGDAPETLFRQCLFAGNSVVDQKTAGTGTDEVSNGGAIYFVSDFSPLLDSCTFVGNSATSSKAANGQGGAVYHKWGGRMVNCIVADNLRQGGTDNSNWVLASAAAYSHNCVHPDSNANVGTYLASANGNIRVDPKFVDAANGDWRLADDSPCKGKGLNEPWMAGALDLAGIARIQGDNVDIGAYEVFIPAAFTMMIR